MLAFYYCNQISKITNLRRGKVYFGLQFLRFQSMVSLPIAFEPLMRQHIIVEEAAHLIGAEKQEKEETSILQLSIRGHTSND
jgi:hypothetical protein